MGLVIILGIFSSLNALLFGLMGIQGMTGNESLWELLGFFVIVFGISFGFFGVTLGLTLAFYNLRDFGTSLFKAMISFTTGGILGGCFLAFLTKLMDFYESVFRTLTSGGSLAIFLMSFVVSAFLVAAGSGALFMRKLRLSTGPWIWAGGIASVSFLGYFGRVFVLWPVIAIIGTLLSITYCLKKR